MPCSLHENVNDPFPPFHHQCFQYTQINLLQGLFVVLYFCNNHPDPYHIQNASPSYNADEFIHLPTKLSQQCCIFSCSLDINLKVQLELKYLTEKITTFDLPIQSKLSKETWVDRLLAATSEAAARP